MPQPNTLQLLNDAPCSGYTSKDAWPV